MASNGRELPVTRQDIARQEQRDSWEKTAKKGMKIGGTAWVSLCMLEIFKAALADDDHPYENLTFGQTIIFGMIIILAWGLINPAVRVTEEAFEKGKEVVSSWSSETSTGENSSDKDPLVEQPDDPVPANSLSGNANLA